ncbi:MAG: cobalt ECF transporter T component CbiQ [Magnetococcales bacterium]|nr:cobalt ECF transporter T component CbiQ [Magnetococcales bacterium]
MSGAIHPLATLGRMDELAQGCSPVHGLDPRAKLGTTLLFVLCVTSFDAHVVAALLPFACFPLFVSRISRIPPARIAQALKPALPFVLAMGCLNPLLDRTPVVLIPGIEIAGGWFSLTSIVLRFGLALSALFLLTATTGMPALGAAARRLGVPAGVIAALLLTWRAIFLIAEEGERMRRAHDLRAFGVKRPPWPVAARLVGHLLLRSLERAQRLHLAMLARGFDGTLPTMRALRFQPRDGLFFVSWSALFLLLRFEDPVPRLGGWMMGLIP